MRDDRLPRIIRPSLALAALAAVVVALGLVITAPAHAASASPKPKTEKSARASHTAKAGAKATAVATPTAAVQRGAEVRAGENVVVPKGTRVPSVVAFGGDVKVDGAVRDAVVVFGGDVTINGSVGQSVVAFGGDVTINGTVNQATIAFGGNVRLTRNAVVGAGLKPSDAVVVVAGGQLTKVPGAQVHGRVERSAGNVDWGGVFGWGFRGLLFSPVLGLSFAGWLLQTVFFLVLALVAAALMPGPMRRVQTQVRHRPWASLGWGALAFFVAVPVIFIAVGITIIGLLLWLPFGLFMLLLYFFATTSLAAVLAQTVLSKLGGKENLMLAVALGVVGTTLVSRIPAIGGLALLVMTVLGTGAVLLAFAEHRRERREAEAARVAALAAAAPAPYPQSATASTASVITPIVQTSPVQRAQAQQPPVQQAPVQQAAAQQALPPAVPAGPPQPPVTPLPEEGAPPPVAPPPEPQPPVTPQPPAAPAAPAGGEGAETEGAGPEGRPPEDQAFAEGRQPGT